MQNQWCVLVEPTINTPEGIRRPDIVVDVTIVVDNAYPIVAHGNKVAYY